jgi:YebC/PmpR family DNA-binding regulatory protein
MSCHSKWHSIRHQKGIKDAKKGKIFTKLGSNITLAAREGGADSETNFKLRLAVDKAKAANMPKENIERAIARAKPGAGNQLEEITYEGFGPFNVALLVKVLTDNKNRTISEVRNVFSKFGGKLANAGSVIHQFVQKGIVTAEGENLEELELAAIDLGATDTQQDEDRLIVYCASTDLHKIKIGLEEKGAQISDADFSFEAQNPVYIREEEQAKKILEMMEAFEEIDEVVRTWANFDIDSGIIKKIV